MRLVFTTPLSTSAVTKVALGAALSLAMAALHAPSAHAAVGVSITVYPSLAPNAFASPSFPDYQTNALAGIRTGGTTTGSGTSQYVNLGDGATISAASAVVTGFPSWMGVAAPNTPAYTGEFGNRMTFGVDIKGIGRQISISDLSFSGASTDSGNALGFGFTGYSYTPAYEGIIYGTGGNPDTIITSGASTQLVDEIVGRGSGNSLPAYTSSQAVDNFGSDPYSSPTLTDQQRIDETPAVFGITNDFNFTGTYSMDGFSGSATVTETVPEPASLALLAAGAITLISRKRRTHM